MVSFTALLAAGATFAGVLAYPHDVLGMSANVNLAERKLLPRGEGTHDGYFYSWWSDGASPATYTNEAGGRYSVQWQAGGNLVGGKGWNPGTARSITYTANWNVVNNGNSYLTVYGWTRNPLIEYYIVEAHGEYNPCSGASGRGTVNYDGATYTLCESTRTNQPSIDGTRTFQQFWAVRQNKRTSGTVDTGFFFNAWSSKNMKLGTSPYYMIMATEAYRSAGSATVTVGTGGGSTQPDPEPEPEPEPEPQPGCSAKWGQCGGSSWNGPTCCESGSSCKAQNQWYSQCT
jgi:endo-1,4-beta-xylanase